MALKVKLHRRARSDLASIRSYLLREAGRQAADHVRLDLVARIQRVGRFSQIGTPANEPGIRVLAPSKYPYRIYFTVTEREVIILHIRHTSLPLPEPDEFD